MTIPAYIPASPEPEVPKDYQETNVAWKEQDSTSSTEQKYYPELPVCILHSSRFGCRLLI